MREKTVFVAALTLASGLRAGEHAAPLAPAAKAGPVLARAQAHPVLAPLLNLPLPKLANTRLAATVALAYAGPDGAVDLDQIDTADTGKFKDSEKGERKALKKLRKDQKTIALLQDIMAAGGEHTELLILQAMDTGGKDGVIKHVMTSVNPQGVDVKSFKKPTAEEAAHPPTWRIDKALVEKEMVAAGPNGELRGNGRIGIMNRGPDEDILNPLVYPERYPNLTLGGLLARIDEYNERDRTLERNKVHTHKFYLHISYDEQWRRLETRRTTPGKQWKLSPADIASRLKWDEFMAAYGVITGLRGYTIIPADRKWYRDFLVGRQLKRDLKALRLRYPKPPPGIEDLVIPK